MKVLINPVTKKPTCFEFPDYLNAMLSGPYQNCMEVSKEWAEAELKRIDSVHLNSTKEA